MSKEFWRLVDGFQGKVYKVTNAIRLMVRNNIPVGLAITYLRIVFGAGTQKEEHIQVCLAAGGNPI